MMTRQEFEQSERTISEIQGSALYDRLLGRYPINAWSNDDLAAALKELEVARPALREAAEQERKAGIQPRLCYFRAKYNADAIAHVRREIEQRRPYP